MNILDKIQEQNELIQQQPAQVENKEQSESNMDDVMNQIGLRIQRGGY